MSQPHQPHHPAATAADATPEWIELRRGMIARDGHAIRAGASLCIELQEANRPDVWLPICTPTGGQLYASADDRDAVLKALWGMSA